MRHVKSVLDIRTAHHDEKHPEIKNKTTTTPWLSRTHAKERCQQNQELTLSVQVALQNEGFSYLISGSGYLRASLVALRGLSHRCQTDPSLDPPSVRPKAT
eukprot:841412-Rhodomonas_salina.1